MVQIMTRRNVPLPPKGSIAYDRLMQPANPRPKRPPPEYYDVYDDPRAWSRVPYPYQFQWDGGGRWCSVSSH